jgi:hypothetical protein
MCEVLRHCLHCFQRQSVAMGGYASTYGAVKGFASTAIPWGWSVAGNREGLVCAGCKRCSSLGIFLWPKKPICSLRAQVPLWLSGSTPHHDITAIHVVVRSKCCHDAYGVALLVHKCMEIGDAAAVAAARQQSGR